jgi:pyruvate/2-oxoglutarate dehydrogenase complex dihydrolipoamide dehydrogenase (E3) component
MPWCTFTDPEIARVGLNEKEATEQNIAYEITRYEINNLDRAITDSEEKGLIKILTEPGRDLVLGVTIIGYRASELIGKYVSTMKHKLGLNKILGTIHIYPTMIEANKFSAGIWKKNHGPQKKTFGYFNLHTTLKIFLSIDLAEDFSYY